MSEDTQSAIREMCFALASQARASTRFLEALGGYTQAMRVMGKVMAPSLQMVEADADRLGVLFRQYIATILDRLPKE